MNQAQVPLIVSRRIDAEPDRVFRVFTRAELLSQWFTPSAEIGLDILAFDFSVGGAFRFRYRMPDGRRPTVGGTYLRIETPAEIAFTWVWEPPDPLAEIEMEVAFRFAADDGGTLITIVHEKLPSDAACSIQEDGWERALDSLQCHVSEWAKNRGESP